MHRASQRPSYPSLVCLALLLLGCAASGQIVQLAELSQQDHFDASYLHRCGVAVLGFERAPSQVDDQQQDRTNYPLFAALQKWHPKLGLTGAKTVRGGLGREPGALAQVEDLLASDRVGELPFVALRSATRGRRLLLSSSLKSDEVIETEAESRDQVAYCTTRAIAVRYRLIDLEQQRVAWQGVIRNRDQDCNENPRQDGLRNAKKGERFGALLGDLFINLLVDAAFGTYPAPPPLLGLTDASADDLASVLPGAVKPKPPLQVSSHVRGLPGRR